MSETQLSDSQPDPTVSIETDGATFKPFVNAIRPIATEGILHFDDDDIHCRVVDKTNVIQASVSLYDRVFESYTTDGLATGARFPRLKGLTRSARKDSDDTLFLRASHGHFESEVIRAYDGVTMATVDTMRTIDPDSVRQEPDPMSPETLDREYHAATIEKGILSDAIKHVSGCGEHIKVRSDNDDFILEGETDMETSTVHLRGIGHGTVGETLLSTSYVNDILKAIHAVDPESVTVHYSRGFPVFFDVERFNDDDELTHEARFGIAPRIRNDDT